MHNPNEFIISTYVPGPRGWVMPKEGVRVTHIPSGKFVDCHSEHSQHANKAVAWATLQLRLTDPTQLELFK